jgi:hypothetical protein
MTGDEQYSTPNDLSPGTAIGGRFFDEAGVGATDAASDSDAGISVNSQ